MSPHPPLRILLLLKYTCFWIMNCFGMWIFLDGMISNLPSLSFQFHPSQQFLCLLLYCSSFIPLLLLHASPTLLCASISSQLTRGCRQNIYRDKTCRSMSYQTICPLLAHCYYNCQKRRARAPLTFSDFPIGTVYMQPNVTFQIRYLNVNNSFSQCRINLSVLIKRSWST